MYLARDSMKLTFSNRNIYFLWTDRTIWFLGSNSVNLLNKAKIHELQQLAPFEIKPQCTKAKKFTGRQNQGIMSDSN